MRQVRPRRHRYVSPFSDRRITLGQAPAYMASVSEVAMRLCRIIPRFSLRTLVVFLLLVTSGVGVWHERKSQWKIGEIDAPEGEVAFVDYSDNRGVLKIFVTHELRALRTAKGISEFDGATVGWTQYIYLVRSGELEGSYNHLDRPEIRHLPPFSRWRQRIFTDGTVINYFIAGKTRLDLEVRHVEIWPGDDLPADRTLAPIHHRIGRIDSGPESLWRVEIWQDAPITVWRQRPWWGVFYLWEFWLTGLFAGVFVWSVARDRGMLGKLEAG